MISLFTLCLAVGLASAAASQTAARTGVVLAGAYRQVGVTIHYDGRYRSLSFPGGDVPLERGVCTDVIVRAYRNAGIDLQVLVHDDLLDLAGIGAHRPGFGHQLGDQVHLLAHEPAKPALGLPDDPVHIDHRRVPNLVTFFKRHGHSLPVTARAADYRPGDIVTWRLPSGVPHIGLVSDQEADGRLLVVHNIGQGARVEDVLFAYTITGHYRYDP